jgi:ATP-dependent Clp protease ATP-binding subunit ClpX
MNLDDIYKQLGDNLEYGLRLVREKTGRNRFFLTSLALTEPDAFISYLLQSAQPSLDSAAEAIKSDTGDKGNSTE